MSELLQFNGQISIIVLTINNKIHIFPFTTSYSAM